ncbi:uncharacterized protein [Zea mays]|uniref:uncharacterized protein n=1 Tax=Zea mays TaxID=4577 RepID=UPI0016526D57|nr:uncharacterized protein LOC118472316 [Zea mays]
MPHSFHSVGRRTKREGEEESGEADLTLADAGGSVIAGGAGALLEVEATAAAADAERVRLVPALAEAARTLPLFTLMARGGRCRSKSWPHTAVGEVGPNSWGRAVAGGPREDEGEVPMLALLRMAEPSVRTTAAMPPDDDASTSLSARSYRR